MARKPWNRIQGNSIELQGGIGGGEARPTMITPFREGGGQIDWAAIEPMVDFYVREGCEGIFAVCQSSEMFYLTPKEQLALARAVCQAADGRLTVIASGHIEPDVGKAIDHLGFMCETGVAAVVLVNNRLASENQDDEVWLENAQRLLDALPGVMFGVYECPAPYKRLLSERTLRFLRDSGRFGFIKDTCCDSALIARRMELVRGSQLKLYNANTATLSESITAGAAGYSGVMANFHPGLYVCLLKLLAQKHPAASALQAFLSLAACLEARAYPTSAKYHFARLGIPMRLDCRSQSPSHFGDAAQKEVEALLLLEELVAQRGQSPDGENLPRA